jgi:hypothetical protein
MRKHLGLALRHLFVAVVQAGSIGTAAFALNVTVRAESARCCLWIAQCNGADCTAKDVCGGNGFCCSGCD